MDPVVDQEELNTGEESVFSGTRVGGGPDGDARGLGAVDFQLRRALAADVASGVDSALLAGRNNIASGNASSCIAGFDNEANDDQASCIGGFDNVASGPQSSCVGGETNVASGDQSSCIGSKDATASGPQAFCIGGPGGHTASGDQSACIGGGLFFSTVTGDLGSLTLGGAFNTVSGDLSSAIMGSLNTVSGGGSHILSGSSQDISSLQSIILGGTLNTIDAGAGLLARYHAIINSESCTITDSMFRSAIIASSMSTIDGGGTGSMILGSTATITDSGNSAVIASSNGVTITDSIRAVILASNNNDIVNSDESVILGGGSGLTADKNTLTDADTCGIIAGQGNAITGAAGVAHRAGILAGHSNTITSAALDSAIIGGDGNTCSAPKTACVGGTNSAAVTEGSVCLGSGARPREEDAVCFSTPIDQSSALAMIHERIPLSATTTDATPTPMLVGQAAAAPISPPTDSVGTLQVSVVARAAPSGSFFLATREVKWSKVAGVTTIDDVAVVGADAGPLGGAAVQVVASGGDIIVEVTGAPPSPDPGVTWFATALMTALVG